MIAKILLIIWSINSFVYFPSDSLNDKTAEYLKTASWTKYQARAQQWQTPEKILEKSIYGEYPKDAINFQIIYSIENGLQGVSRQAILRKLFWEANPPSFEREREREGLKWQKIIKQVHLTMYNHNFQQPLYEDGTVVSDPLLLLEIGSGRCGHIARLIVDIALANGYQARLVQLASHIVAEVYWNEKWHIVDADIANYPIILPNQYWPSVIELGLYSEYINDYPNLYDDYSLLILATKEKCVKNNSTTYFNTDRISYWYKIGDNWKDRKYGWDSLKKEEINIQPIKEVCEPL